MRFTDYDIDAKALSPLNLAFIGDCVYEMLVRETLVAKANRPVNDLHRESVKFVSAKAQTEAFEKLKIYSLKRKRLSSSAAETQKQATCRKAQPLPSITPQRELNLFSVIST